VLVARCYVSELLILVMHHVQLHVHSAHLPAIRPTSITIVLL